MFYFIFSHGNFYRENEQAKQDPIKPTTKASYAMPKSQTSNRFEVLGKTPSPSSSNPQKFAYHTKESRLLLQILEPDHISVSSEISTKKIFQNDKYFISNEILKTRISCLERPSILQE